MQREFSCERNIRTGQTQLDHSFTAKLPSLTHVCQISRTQTASFSSYEQTVSILPANKSLKELWMVINEPLFVNVLTPFDSKKHLSVLTAIQKSVPCVTIRRVTPPYLDDG